MNTHIVLLRGINVSGKKILPMAELRELLSKLKFDNIQTYIQSGNIIVDSNLTQEEVANTIQQGIADQFGYDVPVMVRNIEEWEKAIENNPYPLDNPKIVSFTFLSEAPQEQSIEVNVTNNDEYTIIDDMVYMYCPGGFGNSKLSNNLFERKLKVRATSRNYRTTMKLLEMAKALK